MSRKKSKKYRKKFRKKLDRLINLDYNIPKDIVSKILKGDRRILADEFLKICSALNIDPNIFRDQKAS